MAQPLADVMLEHGIAEHQRRLIFTALTEVFFTYVKVAFFAAAFICFPEFLTQLWRFVAPGLYKHEKSAFLPFLVATPFLFFIGWALVYFIIFPNIGRASCRSRVCLYVSTSVVAVSFNKYVNTHFV